MSSECAFARSSLHVQNRGKTRSFTVERSGKFGYQNKTKGKNLNLCVLAEASIPTFDKISAPKLLKEASKTKKVDPEDLYDALKVLEKEKEKQVSLEALNGQWQLCFTSGTKKVQANLNRNGGGSYFPIQAVQSFNSTDLTIRNGVYLGPVGSLYFDGHFIWREKQRMLEFIFEQISIKLGPLGPLTFNIGDKDAWDKLKGMEEGVTGGQGRISQADGSNIGSNPFFTFVYVDDEVCAARGRGGGLAFWTKIEDAPSS
eukprot:CAMPEP_0196585848 /NCGR_PEP_ID=MMETSP1081-20130531/52265_1 /TAXON_ID=36882 /ORGANISM="Pyramimonas amylifera, Strain CCMP720" /LENGTH=257 /DNA_ID=CAMNT_0041907535 /DNA_START=68 /DNA_END=841 /DNA_ORIENTATION=+